METGFTARAGRQQAGSHHPGIAEGIRGIHPAFITQQQIHPVPGKMLPSQEVIGLLWGAAPSQGHLAAVPLDQGQVNGLGC
jgi:hypothetical protein